MTVFSQLFPANRLLIFKCRLYNKYYRNNTYVCTRYVNMYMHYNTLEINKNLKGSRDRNKK